MRPIIGVDLGATNIRAAAVESDGSCGRIFKRSVPKTRSPENVARVVSELCQEATATVGSDRPEAVGVGLAGWTEAGTGLVFNGPNLGWRDVPFGELLRDALDGREVAITNDLRAIALGEYLFGSGAGAKVLAVVFLGSGIGSSVIIESSPLTGSANMACEIGHVRVVPRGGRACGCGQLGCLEAYVGGHNLERRARHDIETGVTTTLGTKVDGTSASLTCGSIEAAARDGDHYAVTLWEEAADYLSQALGSLVTYLNPDRLILGGGVWIGAPTLRVLTLGRLEYAASPEALSRCELVDPALGDRAGIVGAAALARAASTS